MEFRRTTLQVENIIKQYNERVFYGANYGRETTLFKSIRPY